MVPGRLDVLVLGGAVACVILSLSGVKALECCPLVYDNMKDMYETERPPDTNRTESDAIRPRRQFRWWRKLLLGLVLLTLFIPRVDNFRITPVELIAFEHLFSLVEWEAANFPRKWIHSLINLVPGQKPTREERLELVDEYLKVARLASKEERRIEGASQLRSFKGADTSQVVPSDEYLLELLARKRELQPEAEESIEAEVGAVLATLGLQSRIGMIWPPVDIRFGEPPTLLVISPRDKIDMTGAVFLDPDIEPFERDDIEKRVFDEVNYAAYVDDLAGLATFPNMVNDLYTTRTIVRTAAHEWLHSYWFFHPFGRNYFASTEMTTLNETAATLAGNEIGDIAFERMGGDLSENARRYEAASKSDPNFTRFMRETRIEAERLLDEGQIEEAEEYMRKRQWELRLRGYYIRKLNQAYFAFRGRYADSPASISPVGEQMRELRSYVSDIGELIAVISDVSNPTEFEALLERMRAENISYQS